MDKIIVVIMSVMIFVFFNQAKANNLPAGFVYLKDVDASIIQDMRYAGYHNFIGRPVRGYGTAECILTRQAAFALHQIQAELKKNSLSLKVYDCYRPQMAVDNFVEWSKQSAQQEMKKEFYPHVDKADFFKLNYVAEKSGHTRGSTMDLTLVHLPVSHQAHYHRGQSLVSCVAAYATRFQDGNIDMGTGFDCMDELSHSENKSVNHVAYRHRSFLRAVMKKAGFVPYPTEWWHFTLENEPFPKQYFNFPIQKK
jgi:D-alanyl-D-alanine dipeptidase